MYKNSIGRITSVEFFAAMPPGLFIFIVAFIAFSDDLPLENRRSLLDYFLSLSKILHQYPAAILFMLFAAYIFGSIIRSMPVHWAEIVATFRGSEFPYPDVLKKMLDQMKNEATASHLNPDLLPTLQGVSSHTFNYWKDMLCIRAPEAFSFYQTFEARSRFFTGMFWAGLVGLVSSLIMSIKIITQQYPITPAIHLLFLSVPLIIAFGWQIRRVREQEARLLLALFVAFIQQEAIRNGLEKKELAQ